MKVLILCGGMGVRAFPFTEYLPKPMLPVNGSPILVHIIKSLIGQGYREFVLAAGHRKNVIEDYFESKDLGAAIEIVDTGSDADTGSRIRACAPLLTDTFIVTYGDGLSDLRLDKVVDFHRRHGKLGTVTVVPLVTQYGVLDAEPDGRVIRMLEKPVLREHWLNIGLMVFDTSVFDHWDGDNLERDILTGLSAIGELYMYRHEGFFASLDSYKDQQELERLVQDGRTPWKTVA